MKYRVKSISADCKEFTDIKGHKWKYMSVQQYKKLPEDERRICGDMRKKDSRSASLILRDKDFQIGLFSYDKSKWSERTVGFIPVENEENPEDSCCVRIREISIVKTVLFPLLLACLVAGIILAVFLYSKKDEVPGLEESAIAYYVEGMKNTDPTQIMMPGFTPISAKAGDTHVEYVLYNPEGNPCYFKLQIVLKDTEEVLYESGLLEPGKAIMEFDLSRPLEAGTYNVTINAETFSVDDYESALNKGAVDTTIIVE